MNRPPANKRNSGPTPARALALQLTCTVRRRGAYLRELVDAARKETQLPSEEFAYAQVLAFGVVMCVGTLDELVNRNLNTHSDIKPNVRDALRISAYELLFLEKPAHVVVDQGVELVRSVSSQAAGLGNAVLHKMASDAAGFPWGDPAVDERAFARCYGVPTWLAVDLIEQYGRDVAAALLDASLAPAPTYLCENPYRPELPFASDLAAQFVASLVPCDVPILEIGSGRGTKTMLIEARSKVETGEPCEIHAVDVHEYRKKLLDKRMRAMGIGAFVHAHVGDARDLGNIEGLPKEFAAVLVDAPCSGTGTLRRHPEIRWKLKHKHVAALASLQLELLCEAASHVASGGTLVYATCSVLREENRKVVERFLASEQGRGFTIVPVTERLRGFCSTHEQAPAGWEASVTPEGCFASVPAADAPDGHFASVFIRSF